MTTDDDFHVSCTEEKEWLVKMVPPLRGEPEENAEQLDWIGRLFGFATVTKTEMLAQVGDADPSKYRLWFSFDRPEHKASFLELVQRDRYVDRDEQRCFDRPHSLEDLPTLRPLAYVFPKEYMKRIIAMATVTAEETDDGNRSNN